MVQEYSKEQTYITISLEEYKDLLETKGKYEELKSLYTPYYKPTITYTGGDGGVLRGTDYTYPYKTTCDTAAYSTFTQASE